MAETLKVLGQVVPSASVLTDAYVVPASAVAVASSLVMCNQGSAEAKIRVAIAVGGAADDPKQYLYYDAILMEKDTLIATVGITLATTDVVRVYSDTGQVSFNLFGTEVR